MDANSPWLNLFRKQRRAESKRRQNLEKQQPIQRGPIMNIQFPTHAAIIAYAFQSTNAALIEEWITLCKRAYYPMPAMYQEPLQIDFDKGMVFHNAAGVMWALPILHAIHGTNTLDRAKLALAVMPTSDTIDRGLKAVYGSLTEIEVILSQMQDKTRDMVDVVAPLTAKRTRNREYTNPIAAKMHRDMLASCRVSKVPNKRYMCDEWEDYAEFERYFMEVNMKMLPKDPAAPEAPARYTTRHAGIICDSTNTYGPLTTYFVPLNVQHMFNRTKSNFMLRLAEFENANPGTITPEMRDFMLRAKT